MAHTLRLIYSIALFTAASATHTGILDKITTTKIPEDTDKSEQHGHRECDLYLAPSTIKGAGRGVIAGKSFFVDDVIDFGPTIAFQREHSDLTQFINYVYPSNYKNFNMHIFGPSSLYNHMKDKTVSNEWSENEEHLEGTLQRAHDHSIHKTCTHVALKPINFGEEMFTSYGDHWFAQRGLFNVVLPNTTENSCNSTRRCSTESTRTFNNTCSTTSAENNETCAYESHNVNSSASGITGNATTTSEFTGRPLTKSELQQHGQCLSDVYIRKSLLHKAGLGLHAKRDFKAGEIVSVSPVLTLPKYVVDATYNDSVLINYCIADGGSDMVLFPLSYPALINHASNSHEPANVKIEWFDWSVNNDNSSYGAKLGNVFSVHDKLKMNTTELFNAPFAQLDIAYIASEDIMANEEIRMDYGNHWLPAWETYLEEVQPWEEEAVKWAEKYDGDTECYEKLHKHPLFRQYIKAREGLFPDHWYTE